MASEVSIDYSSLSAHIQSLLPPQSRPLLSRSVFPTLVHSIVLISRALRASHHVGQVGTANVFGDNQLNVDVLAEDIIRSEIGKCSAIVTASSEEDPKEQTVPKQGQNNDSEIYTIAFDPLDGSSIIPSNWTVGTIVGIWDGATALNRDPSTHQIASVLGVLGPRTTAVIALRLPDSGAVSFEVGLGETNGRDTCEVIRPRIELAKPPFKTRYFAPANLRAAAEDEKYMQLVNHFIREKYTLRYSGGLVPDVVHILVKGHGIYISPVTIKSRAKLRRLFELLPIALIMEGAGAVALDPASGKRTMGQPVQHTDERAGLLCGTAEEVEFASQSLGLR